MNVQYQGYLEIDMHLRRMNTELRYGYGVNRNALRKKIGADSLSFGVAINELANNKNTTDIV